MPEPVKEDVIKGNLPSHAKVVIVGGGVVGCSILFHLAKFGWKDSVLLERDELTSGSSWHAAGQIHTISSDPNISRLQSYTINLYKEIEELSGHSVGLHMTGGFYLASNKTCQVSRKPRGERASALRRAEKGGHHIGKHSALLVRAHKLTLRLPALLHLEECPHTVIPPSTTRRRPGNKSGAGEARAGSKKTRPQQDLPAIILHQQCGTSG